MSIPESFGLQGFGSARANASIECSVRGYQIMIDSTIRDPRHRHISHCTSLNLAMIRTPDRDTARAIARSSARIAQGRQDYMPGSGALGAVFRGEAGAYASNASMTRP